jgi:nuclear pore complex protein Nup133
MCAAEDSFARVVWLKSLKDILGAGGTHGELCVRFASEDLREPIIKDNLLDDDMLREHLQKNRLAEWFAAAWKAGKMLFELESGQQGQLQIASAAPHMASNGAAPETEVEMVQEPAGSDTFDGDDESGQGQDIEMQDS